MLLFIEHTIAIQHPVLLLLLIIGERVLNKRCTTQLLIVMGIGQ